MITPQAVAFNAFSSENSINSAYRPMLEITFVPVPVPEPATYAILASLLMLVPLAQRKKEQDTG